MNNDTKYSALPDLIEGVIKNKASYIDNLFADTWKEIKLNKWISLAGFKKRSGIDITEAVFLLLLWKWLNVSSIAMFSRQALNVFSQAKKDVMYDLLKREDVNWRGLNIKTAKEIYRQHKLGGSPTKVFVLDDSIKKRKGKKMEGISSHFDHVDGRNVMGQQVLTLGLATDDAFLPVDSQIFVSQVKAQKLIHDYKDRRSIVGKRYDEATTQGKPEMAKNMMKRAIRHGINADYVVADAWFGTKPMIRSAMDLKLCPIYRMKKNKMKYRAIIDGQKKQLFAADELYSHAVKHNWRKVNGVPWKAAALYVELDLSTTEENQERWEWVQLLFVRGLEEPDESDKGKKSWALFLTPDTQLSMSKLLEIYSLRWGIEVYFKEAKQHLGFLKEQTVTFASHTASIHLCAIRYLMLMHTKLQDSDLRACDVRAHIKTQLNVMSFAGDLWKIFRIIISESIKGLQDVICCSTDIVMQKIDDRMNDFFVQSLQLDTFTMQLEYE